MVNSIPMFRILLGVILALGAVGCGKAARPRAPEYFAPDAVKNLQVTGEADGVLLSWEAPENDSQGKSLRSIDGYRIYRRPLLAEEGAAFVLVASVQDRHLLEREALRQKLKQEGKPSRRADVSADKKRFMFKDTSVARGVSYLYSVVPYNQGDVEGRIFDLLKVTFSGKETRTVLVAHEVISDDSLEEGLQ